MIYVRIELWPAGDRASARLLQEVTISNVGGDKEHGDYLARVSHSTTLKGDGFDDPQIPSPSTVWKIGKVKGWSRRLSPVDLLMSALQAALGSSS